jgi:hypothetical protein
MCIYTYFSQPCLGALLRSVLSVGLFQSLISIGVCLRSSLLVELICASSPGLFQSAYFNRVISIGSFKGRERERASLDRVFEGWFYWVLCIGSVNYFSSIGFFKSVFWFGLLKLGSFVHVCEGFLIVSSRAPSIGSFTRLLRYITSTVLSS